MGMLPMLQWEVARFGGSPGVSSASKSSSDTVSMGEADAGPLSVGGEAEKTRGDDPPCVVARR